VFARALRSFVNTLLFVAALGVFGGLVVAGVDVWRDGRWPRGWDRASVRDLARDMGERLETLGGRLTSEAMRVVPAVDPLSAYLDAMAPRDDEIRALAAKLVAGCDDADHVCETGRLLRFVADDIAYRSDPRGGPDYVQPPSQTLAIQAGDCEDQTILLASLLETIGVRTYLAFSKHHAYPLACFDEPLPDLARELNRRHGKDARYLKQAGLSRKRLRTLRKGGLTTYTVGDEACYPLEPTAKGAWLGRAPDGELAETLIDPVRRRRIRVSQPQS